MKFTILVDASFESFLYPKFAWSVPGSWKEDFKDNIVFSLYNLCDPRGHEIYNFGKPFHSDHYYALSYKYTRRFLKKIMQFHYMTNLATP